MTPDIRRLIIRAPNPLGDALMALPAMAAIRAAMAGRHLIVAATPGVAPLFEEITVASPDAIVVVDKRNEAAQLRERRADAVVLLTNSFRTAWVSRQAAVPQRWGYRAHARSLLLTRAVARPRTRVHQSEYYLRLVRELGLDPAGPGLNFTVAPGSLDPGYTSQHFESRPPPALAPTPFLRSSVSTARDPSSVSHPAPRTATPSAGRRPASPSSSRA